MISKAEAGKHGHPRACLACHITWKVDHARCPRKHTARPLCPSDSGIIQRAVVVVPLWGPGILC